MRGQINQEPKIAKANRWVAVMIGLLALTFYLLVFAINWK